MLDIHYTFFYVLKTKFYGNNLQPDKIIGCMMLTYKTVMRLLLKSSVRENILVNRLVVAKAVKIYYEPQGRFRIKLYD